MFPGFGTLVNVLAVLVGGFCGILFGKSIKENVKDTLITVDGVTVMMMGVAGTVANMLTVTESGFSTEGSMMMIVSLLAGGVIGELCRLEDLVNRFGEWLKKKSGSGKDSQFVSAFVTSSCTICIGAMAIIGSIEDGLNENPDVLISKSILDAIFICIMVASMGKGCIFSAVPVAILQGSVTILAVLLGGFLPSSAVNAVSFIGSILIFCVGLNFIREKKIRVTNLLPALVIAAVWGAIAG